MAKSHKRWTTKSMLVAVVLTLTVGVAGAAWAHDARLDLAKQNLHSASLLLQAADEVTQSDPKTERAYSRHLEKAVDAIAEATAAIDKAASVADAP